jgi:hypothetical protein
VSSAAGKVRNRRRATLRTGQGGRIKAEAYPPRKERRQSSRRRVLPDGCNLEGNYDAQKTPGSHTETTPKTKNLLNQQKKITQVKQRGGAHHKDKEPSDEGQRNHRLMTQTATEKSMIELHRSGVPGKGQSVAAK